MFKAASLAFSFACVAFCSMSAMAAPPASAASYVQYVEVDGSEAAGYTSGQIGVQLVGDNKWYTIKATEPNLVAWLSLLNGAQNNGEKVILWYNTVTSGSTTTYYVCIVTKTNQK